MLNLGIFLSLSLGIVVGWYFSYFPIILIILLAISLIFWLYFTHRKGKLAHFNKGLFLFAFILGVIWVNPYTYRKIENNLNRDTILLIEVASLKVDRVMYGEFYAYIKSIDGYPAYTRVKVRDFNKREVKYGERYLVKGKLTSYKLNHTPLYTLWIKKDNYLKRMFLSPLYDYARGIVDRLDTYFYRLLTPQSYRFMGALFLGRREYMERGEKKLFIKAGIAHLFALSGLHIGLLAGVIFFILKIMHIKFHLRLVISILFIFFYALCVGFRPSILRAAIMYSLWGFSFFLRRRVDLKDVLGLAGIGSLLINPLWIFEIGFQLSYLAVFGLIEGFRIVKLNFSSLNKLMNYIKGIFFGTLFVNIMVAPLMFFYFGKLYILGLLSNSIFIPLFTLIIIVAFTLILFYPVSFFASFVAEVLSLIVMIFMELVKIIGEFKFSYISLSFSWRGVVVYYLIIIIIYIFLRKDKKYFLY